MVEHETIYFYKPEGVIDFLWAGSSSFVGIVDDTTVLKYPDKPGDEQILESLDLEARILARIGPHKNIIGFKGQRQDGGLLFERARHGSIFLYLQENTPSTQQRISWARQAAEAIAATHRAGVIHRDVSASNLLLDDDLTLKLCDFQGRLLRLEDGGVEKDGISCEATKSTMPRADINHSDHKTDIFALGSALYYIMQGHEPYPDLTSRDEEEIQARFRSGQFPEMTTSPLMQRVTHKCWAAQYDSAEAILQDFESGDSSTPMVGVDQASTVGEGDAGPLGESPHSNPVTLPHV